MKLASPPLRQVAFRRFYMCLTPELIRMQSLFHTGPRQLVVSENLRDRTATLARHQYTRKFPPLADCRLLPSQRTRAQKNYLSGHLPGTRNHFALDGRLL